MGIAMMVLEVLVGLAFLGAGGQKLAGAKSQKADFERFGYPSWFMYLTGAIELTGAVGMFVGVFVPVWGALAGLWLGAVMAGAIATHLRVKDPLGKMAPPAVLLLLAVTVSAIYFLG
jgi:uncharacterized membrane protein YphA (DoxX/SURF4 family)